MTGAINIRVGVLALQGGFSEHVSHLRHSATQISTKIQVQEVRTGSDLECLDGLVIPGGESTSMSILLGKNLDLCSALKKFVQSGRPVFGTCAGLILLANEVEEGQVLIGGLDVKVIRNYYGSQQQSFEAFVVEVKENEDELEGKTRMLFIRAPGIVLQNEKDKARPAVRVLAKHKDSVVAVQQKNLIATSFHPELTSDLNWHIYFLKMVIESYKNNSGTQNQDELILDCN